MEKRSARHDGYEQDHIMQNELEIHFSRTYHAVDRLTHQNGNGKLQYDREDGEHRQGVAIDYMRGTADYHNVAGEGDVRRGGIWLYDTWLGDKGHYTDYVLKFGRLSNDFEIYARSTGEKITGDYSNFVYSASAEYGRKKDLGNDWYIEPQAQIQYAHVTDADYTTSQDTQVELDAIDSLIGRVGFRLGRDIGEKNNFYILHTNTIFLYHQLYMFFLTITILSKIENYVFICQNYQNCI